MASPQDARFAKRFLVVTPGITIRDRLRVLRPMDAVNYYDQRDLVPPDLKAAVAMSLASVMGPPCCPGQGGPFTMAGDSRDLR